MAYNVVSCVASLGNTGLSNCLDNLGYDAMLIWTVNSFEFATEADAETEADWLTAINVKNVYPFPLFDESEPAIEDDVEQDFPTGISVFVREGKYGGIGRMRVSLCDLPKLRTFNEVQGRAFIVTGNGKVFGTSSDGVKFKGFKLSKFHVSALKGTDGSTKRMVEVRYQFKHIEEMADYPAVPQLTWDPLDLIGVVDVTIEVTASAAAEVTVSVTRNCDAETVDGLVEADFTLLDSNGDEQLPSDGFTDNGDGTYTFDFSENNLGADDYTINLLSPSAQTTGGYETAAADSFTISA